MRTKRLTVSIDPGGSGAFGQFRAQATQEEGSLSAGPLPYGQPAPLYSTSSNGGQARRGNFEAGNLDG